MGKGVAPGFQGLLIGNLNIFSQAPIVRRRNAVEFRQAP